MTKAKPRARFPATVHSGATSAPTPITDASRLAVSPQARRGIPETGFPIRRAIDSSPASLQLPEGNPKRAFFNNRTGLAS